MPLDSWAVEIDEEQVRAILGVAVNPKLNLFASSTPGKLPAPSSTQGYLLTFRRRDGEIHVTIMFAYRDPSGKPSLVHEFQPGFSRKPFVIIASPDFTEELFEKMIAIGIRVPAGFLG